MKNINEKIVFVGASRTPVGSFLGDLKTLRIQELGVIALDETIKRSKLNKEDIDEVIVGNVIGSQTSSNVAKIIALDANLPTETTAMTVNRVCGSGMQSIISGSSDILLGKRKVVAAGGVESLSRAPYQLPEEARFQGLKLGDTNFIDTNLEMHRSLSGDNSDITHMADTTKNLIKKYNITREQQDKFAFESHKKASASFESGRLSKEIVPVKIKQKRGEDLVINRDGDIRSDISLEKLSTLRPAFEKDGSITAGNACSLNDGAAFTILTSESYAKEKKLEILGTLLDYEIVGVDPIDMGLAPFKAIKKLLKSNNLDLEKDIDFLEINEAFAGQTLACIKELGIDMDTEFYKSKFNVNGGAIAIGHPLGMSGTRLVVTALYEFKYRPNARYAIVSACIGGGQAIALLLENGNLIK